MECTNAYAPVFHAVKVFKIQPFFLCFLQNRHTREKVLPTQFESDTGDFSALFQSFSGVFFASLLTYRGQMIKSALKLCLQPCTHRLHIRLYCRLPFSPRKKAHSVFHVLLLLIGHAPGHSSPASLLREACALNTHALPPPAGHEWRSFHQDREA